MSINLDGLGWWADQNEFSTRLNKVVLPESNGKTLVLAVDPNDADAPSNYGDHTNSDELKIWEVDAAFENAVLVATINFSGLDKPYDTISADLFEDNSIGIVYKLDTGDIRYRKINSGTWTAENGGETVASPGAGANTINVDISISEANVPVVSWLQSSDTNPKLQLRAGVRRTSDSTWVVTSLEDVMTSHAPNNAMASLSTVFAKGGAAATRPFMAAVCSAQDAGSDFGSRIYSAVVNEGTGAIVNWTLQKSYLAGNMTTKWGAFPRRTYLFRSGTTEVTIAHMETRDKVNLLVARCSWDGNTWLETIPPQTSVVRLNKLDPSARMAASYANDRVNFYYVATASGVNTVFNYIAVIDRVASSVRYSGPFRWDNQENKNDAAYPMAGTGKFANIATNEVMMYFTKNGNGGWTPKVHDVKAAPAPTAVTPGDGTTALTGTPALSMKAALGKQFPQSRHKAIWQFALDAGFATSLKTYVQDDSKFITIENTQMAGSYVYISDTLPPELALTSGNWFVRGALVDEFGIQGAWSSAGSVGLSHPPMATGLLPNSGSFVASGNVTFSWNFTDPLATDAQTAYQIIVERNDTGAVVYDSGKVPSGDSGHIAAITQTGTLLRWKIQVWDTDDISGGYSDYAMFGVAGPPSVTIDAPTPASVVASGTPGILFTPTVDGGRHIKAYQVVIKQDGVVVKNSGTVAVDVVSGTQITWRPPLPLLENNAAFEVQAFVTDDMVISASSSVVSFTVVQNTPATASGVTASSASYNLDDAGYNTVRWDDLNRDIDFVSWVIYRKDDLLDSTGAVVDAGEYVQIGEVSLTTDQYVYRDYYAPSGYHSTYMVRQLVNRNGDLAMSVNDPIATTDQSSEGYWLIQPAVGSVDAVAFRLAGVTEDSYSPEWEETEYTIIGRGRHIDQGDYLGVKGSLTAKLRDSVGMTARQKKIQLENARDLGTAIYLRNPFGDVWSVSIGNLSISRIAGVGKSEFVDVTVPYAEVAQ